MIFIDTSAFEPPPEWKERARRFKAQVQALPADQRAFFINHHAIWRELRPFLEELSHGKCWYCERKWVREDPHVDHFRPKNRIKNKDGSEEEGYYWLAYEYTNFRLACSYCNCLHSGSDEEARGKSDQFPLDPRSKRATPDSNIDDEVALLIDPTKLSDPPLLWFLDSGEITSRASRGFTQMRALETINILNLNDIRLVEARKALWNQCQSLMRRADKAYKKYDELRSVAANSEYEQTLLEMCNLIRRDKEFSATARACFHGSPYFWITSEIR